MMRAVPATLKPYARVRVAAIRDDRFATLQIHYWLYPAVGDIAVIVHTHQADYAYEVECSVSSNGETLWLDPMYIDEFAACPE